MDKAFFKISFSQTVYMDSSWVWLTDIRPFDILLPIAAATIAVEVLAIWLIPGTGKLLKTTGVVVVANAASFLLPYFFLLVTDSWYGSFQDKLDAGSNYIVSVLFLLLTVAVELPIVYLLLRKDSKSRKVLLVTIVAANAVTTAMAAAVEHLITFGYYV